MSKQLDLIGLKFGRLTVIFKTDNYKNSSRWLCRCDCGKHTTIFGWSLTSKRPTRSCGCIQKEISKKLAKNICSNRLNLENKQFERLTPIKQVGRNKRQGILWLCKCSCGNEHVTSAASLQSGNTTSCGCKNRLSDNHNWRGGKSFEVYPREWNTDLKRSIRKRDNYVCVICGKPGNSVHHIDYDKNNCSKENLVTLCRSCHAKTNYNRSYWKTKFSNEVLP